MLRQETLWRWVVIVVAFGILGVYWVRAVSLPLDGDFKGHREFGRRFLDGRPLYEGGRHVPYPPFWALFHAPAALLPLRPAKAILYPVGVAAIAALFLLLHRSIGQTLPLRKRQLFWVAALAAFLSSNYLMRDLAELGVNSLIVLLSWLAAVLWVKHRDWPAGACLGLATALKCTPALFILFFLWKRQWKLVGLSLLFAAVFTAAPIFVQGPESYSRHMRAWFKTAFSGFATEDPSVGALGPEVLQNRALRPSLARYLIELPADHPGRAPHPAYLDFFDLRPRPAAIIINVILVAILAAALWWWRNPVIRRCDPELFWQFAGVSLLCLIFSPITWAQHCVGALPACYLVSAFLILRYEAQAWTKAVIGGWIVWILILNREVVGKPLHWLLQSYHIETFLILALLAVLMVWSRGTGHVRTTEAPQTASPLKRADWPKGRPS